MNHWKYQMCWRWMQELLQGQQIEAKYNKIISICYNNLRLMPEAAFGMRNAVRIEILNSWISLLRFHLNVRDFKILIFTCNLQSYSQSHWPHSCQPFHDFAWYYSTIPSLKLWMGLVAGTVSEVIPTAGRMLDGGFVNSAVSIYVGYEHTLSSTLDKPRLHVPGRVSSIVDGHFSTKRTI